MAVFTKLTNSEIASHLRKYSIGEFLSFQEIIAGIDNSNFLLNTTKGKFILTIFESRINKNDLPFFINFKLHLAQNGISCPRPIVDNKGQIIVELKEKKSVIVTFLDGKNLQPQDDGYYNNITTKHCEEVGKILAQMHLAAKSFKVQRKNDLAIDCFKPLFNKIANHVAKYQKNLDEEILQEINFIETHWKPNLPGVAAHLDLFPDNVFFDENKNVTGVIDFYFAANDLAIYDFAIVVNAWCFDEKNNFIEEKFLAIKNNYENLRNFLPEELAFLKIACRAAAMRFLLTRLHDMFFTTENSLVKIKNPQEYLAKLNYFQNSPK